MSHFVKNFPSRLTALEMLINQANVEFMILVAKASFADVTQPDPILFMHKEEYRKVKIRLLSERHHNSKGQPIDLYTKPLTDKEYNYFNTIKSKFKIIQQDQDGTIYKFLINGNNTNHTKESTI